MDTLTTDYCIVQYSTVLYFVLFIYCISRLQTTGQTDYEVLYSNKHAVHNNFASINSMFLFSHEPHRTVRDCIVPYRIYSFVREESLALPPAGV